MIDSAVVWRGLSELDHVTPICVVLTGMGRGSRNRKTGAMVQAYIVVQGWTAKQAIDNGADFAVCGDCPKRGHRGKGRTCYVSLATGLGVVGRRVARGGYPVMSLASAAQAIVGRQLRIGTYGDPAAVPAEVWRALLENISGWTGYTHQWRHAQGLAPFLMASADTAEERTQANAEGWRTFRVRAVAPNGLAEPLRPGEVVCPASAEAGKRVTCDSCQLCRGQARQARDVAIVDHSTQALAKIRRLPMLKSA